MVAYTDKSKNYYSQELTALRAVREGGGRMPQKGNRTGLQEVHGAKGGVQPGRVAKENGEEGREGRGMAAVVVGAGSRQHSVVVGVGRAGFANSDQHGFDGETGNGGVTNFPFSIFT